ncbi:MAG: hypothetical protein Q9186_001315 [Xanthomendoza sp. 1 TL-2023]
MTSPTQSYVDDLAALATKPTGRTNAPAPADSIIAVPGVETLPESQRITVLERLEQRLRSGHPDADALRSRLQDITPPPDEEEDEEECRVLETQARQDLENDGCPPCYPPSLDVPVRNPPEEYRQIIEYWQSFSSTDDAVLCAQRSDWRKFRQAQRRLRHRYRNISFSIFVDEVRGRRRAHSLDDNVHLLLDPQQQSRQQTWIEFQDYHLKRHEWQEKKRDELQKDLINTPKEAGVTDMEGSEHAAQQERAIHPHLEYAERNLRWHEVFLCWIEQCRLATDPLPLTPVDKGSSDQNSSFNRQRRSKRPNTQAVLGKVRVSKSTPKRQTIPTRTSKATITTPIPVASAVTIPGSAQQMPKRREVKPRRAKEKALAQLLPQRVAKANRVADIKTMSRSRTQCSGNG